MDRVAERVSSVMGIARVCRAARVAKDPEAAIGTAVAMAAGRDGSFAVRARRRDKRFPLTSAGLAREIGARVQRAYGYPVNLSRPDLTIVVEVDQHEVFVYTGGAPGQGGLPVRAGSGRALVLMSGGIDSPVAGYRMMRRGLRCDFLHFSGMPLTGPESVYKAYGLMHQLDRFQCDSRMYVVAFSRPSSGWRQPAQAAPDRGAAPADAQDGGGAGPPPSARPPWSPATHSARSAARRWPTSPRWTTRCRCRCCAR